MTYSTASLHPKAKKTPKQISVEKLKKACTKLGMSFDLIMSKMPGKKDRGLPTTPLTFEEQRLLRNVLRCKSIKEMATLDNNLNAANRNVTVLKYFKLFFRALKNNY